MSHNSAHRLRETAVSVDEIDSPAVVDVLFLRVLLAALVSWLDRQQHEALAYLIEENHVLRRQLRGRRLRLSDDDCRRLARSVPLLSRPVSGSPVRSVV
jgi:hypothetical protein